VLCSAGHNDRSIVSLCLSKDAQEGFITRHEPENFLYFLMILSSRQVLRTSNPSSWLFLTIFGGPRRVLDFFPEISAVHANLHRRHNGASGALSTLSSFPHFPFFWPSMSAQRSTWRYYSASNTNKRYHTQCHPNAPYHMGKKIRGSKFRNLPNTIIMRLARPVVCVAHHKVLELSQANAVAN
jgi:hypothetical protein